MIRIPLLKRCLQCNAPLPEWRVREGAKYCNKLCFSSSRRGKPLCSDPTRQAQYIEENRERAKKVDRTKAIEGLIRAQKETNAYRKGKTVEEIYGVEKSLQIRSNLSKPKKNPPKGFQSGKLGKTYPELRRSNERYAALGLDWILAVKTRDSFTCTDCGFKESPESSKKLHAHHIKPWDEYPDLRFVVSNGRTLCVTCHRRRHREENL